MLMPLVIILTGMIFYLTFYLYNQCVVAQDTYLLAFRGSLCCGEEAGKVKQYVMEEIAGQYGQKYVGAAHFDSKVDADSKKVTVEARGTLAAGGWRFGAKWQAERICPTNCVRNVRLVQKVKAGITDRQEKNKKEKDGIK